MSILVVGSIAYDTLETPVGKRDNVLGGTATHFSTSASFFTDVHVVGVVGGDFERSHIEFLESRGINLEGLQIVEGGKTFRWAGHYLNNLNQAETLDTQLGVFEHFNPTLSDAHSSLPILFLGNIQPQLQLRVLDQMKEPRLIAMDTMNLWIEHEREALQQVIERIDLLFVNDGEAKLLTGESNMVVAAKKIHSWGPKTVVIKRGEHGALLYHEHSMFVAPGMPLPLVTDPTGAGDTFAGVFLGYLARAGKFDENALKQAVISGSVMASFQVEDFGLDRLRELEHKDIDGRFRQFKTLSHFDEVAVFGA